MTDADLGGFGNLPSRIAILHPSRLGNQPERAPSLDTTKM
jgi:hypothetical protein